MQWLFRTPQREALGNLKSPMRKDALGKVQGIISNYQYHYADRQTTRKKRKLISSLTIKPTSLGLGPFLVRVQKHNSPFSEKH